jgi:hypothetical protein
MNYELELITMVQKVQAEQKEYWSLKRKYGNATQQLDLCKKLEKELKEYCNKRKKEIENIQTQLF